MYAYGASDEKHLHLRPNNLLLWSAIEHGCNKNLEYFDFGRTSPDRENLLTFKNRWNAENHEIPYYYHPKIPNLASSNRSALRYRLMTNLWSRIPTVISKTLGPIFLKHLG